MPVDCLYSLFLSIFPTSFGKIVSKYFKATRCARARWTFMHFQFCYFLDPFWISKRQTFSDYILKFTVSICDFSYFQDNKNCAWFAFDVHRFCVTCIANTV